MENADTLERNEAGASALGAPGKDDDNPALPDPSHNLPDVTQIGKEMAHHAALWRKNVEKGDAHQREIMVRAYRLRYLAVDEIVDTLVTGMLAKAKVPVGKNSARFTQLLNFAFLNADWPAEKSRVSRWAGALQHAWNHDPRPAPDAVLEFIEAGGGDVACAEKAREAATGEGSSGSSSKDGPKFSLSCNLPDDLLAHAKKTNGKKFIPGKFEETESGWQFVPRIKVVSNERTQSRFLAD